MRAGKASGIAIARQIWPSCRVTLWVYIVLEARSSCKPIPTGFSTRTEIGNMCVKSVYIYILYILYIQAAR